MLAIKRYLAPGGLALAVAFIAGCEDASLTQLTGTDGTVAADHLSNPVCETIDFDDLTHGAAVTAVNASVIGIDFTVSVTPEGDTQTPARVYDSDNVGGEDPDLENTLQGTTFGPCLQCTGGLLILQEGGGSDVPDDSDDGGLITFTFDDATNPSVVVDSFEAIDQDVSPTVETITFIADNVTTGAQSTGQGDGSVEDLAPHATVNSSFAFDFTGSGAVDDIKLCVEGPPPPPPGAGEGCTPGYWKNLKKHGDEWTSPFTPSSLFGDAFTATCTAGPGNDSSNLIQSTGKTRKLGIAGVSVCDITLIQALNAGGGGVNALARHAVAALLNAAHPDVSYDLSVGGVQDEVNEALSGTFDSDGTDSLESTKDSLAAFNEQGCPLN